VVPEDSPEMFFVWKYFILKRQKHTGTVYQINDRQLIFNRNFLGTKIFLGSHRKPCSCFYGGVVSYYYTLPSAHITNACNHSCRRAASCFSIHSFCCKCAYFKENR